MLKIITLDLVIDNELVSSVNFTNRNLAEAFANGVYGNIKDEKKESSQFIATECLVYEDIDEVAIAIGKSIGLTDEEIESLNKEIEVEVQKLKDNE